MVVVKVGRVADACGLAVPLYKYRGERSPLAEYAEPRGPECMEWYKRNENRESGDRFGGLRSS